MCHPEVPEGTPIPNVTTVEAPVPLAGGEQMPGLLALPRHTPAAAVLIVNDIFGRSPFYENLAQRLAQAGFIGYTPEFFFRLEPLAERTLDAARARRTRLDERDLLRDLDAALNWLAARPEVGGNPVGVIGFCMGGTVVLDFVQRADVAAGVCYYGFPGAPRPDGKTSIEHASQMRAPVLGLWGDQDAGVGMENVERLPHEIHVYPGLGHGFLSASLEDASTPGYEAACRSWTRTIAFYREHLRVRAPA
jgi:carboxymethylenebutenolidase